MHRVDSIICINSVGIGKNKNKIIRNLLGLGMGAWFATTRASSASDMLLNSNKPLELLSAVENKITN